MNYKEKYEQSLERAKDMLAYKEVRQEDMEYLFPELQENKDEKIRKGLIKAVSGILKGNTLYGTDVTREEALTWLEKQGESDETKAKMFLINKGYPIDTNGIFPTYEEIYNIIRDGLENQNPAWCEKDKNILNRLIGVLDGTNEEDYHEAWEETFLPWLKSLKERMQPQSKQYEYLEDFDNEEDYGIDGLYHAINILEKTIGRVEGYQSDDGILSHKVAINAVKELYKKQGEKKSVDKAESKFKVGDWCIDKQDGTIFRIEKVMENIYKYKTDKGNLYYCSHGSLELDSRLWTIKDAKDGDVLYLQHEGVEHVIIYKRLVKKNFHTILSVHCAYDGSTNDFFDDVDSYHCITSERDEKEIHPATKEQRDLLFAKMKEAGYEWDSDNKELKKIEYKFNVDDWIVTDDSFGKIVRHIDEICFNLIDKRYVASDENGLIYNISFSNENKWHKWTIADAKDGDILMTTAIRNCPFIYRKTGYNNNLAYYYAGIDGSGDFCEGCIKRTSYHFGPLSNVVPATKEQRDLFFQKMKEAGYEWDSDKKELKKIEPKTLDVDKVIEWLRIELDKEEKRHYIHVHGFDKERREIFFEDFRKAMKGE